MWDKGDPRLQVETENSEHPAEPEEDDIVPIAELDDYITAYVPSVIPITI